MRYKVFFKSGNTLSYETDQANLIFTKQDLIDLVQLGMDVNLPLVNMNNVEYIIPEDLIEDAGSGVVVPRTPMDLKRQAEADRLKKIENPHALIADIRQKAEPDNEESS